MHNNTISIRGICSLFDVVVKSKTVAFLFFLSQSANTCKSLRSVLVRSRVGCENY